MIQRIQNSKWVFVLISVFLAVIFWMYVRNDLDPPGSRTIYNVPVTLTGETILESQGLTITAVSDTAVDLKITAPISILNKLSNRNLSVTVNVSQCTEGEQILQYDVNWPRDVSTAEITKESQEPAAITVMVARLYSKTFEIQPVLKASIAPGYQAGQITISPETVTISGSEEAVSRVAKVEAVLEGEELNTRFSGNVPLVLLDAEGNELTDLEINMDTDTTYVTMPVYVVKEVKLTVDYTPGGGATGEDVTSAIIFPDSITIAGSEEDVSKVEEISLGSIDLSKVVGTNSFTLPIELDSSLENVSGITEAVVTVTISGLSTRTFNVTNIDYDIHAGRRCHRRGCDLGHHLPGLYHHRRLRGGRVQGRGDLAGQYRPVQSGGDQQLHPTHRAGLQPGERQRHHRSRRHGDHIRPVHPYLQRDQHRL